MKKIIFICLLIIIAVFCYGQSNFTKGEELMMYNKPSEALEFLIRAMSDDPSSVTVYLYLGIVYEQLGMMDEAIAIYRRALPIAGNLSANVANNLGNLYFHRGNIDMAEQYYTQAIGFNGVFSGAFLGRANIRIKAGNLQNAVADYEHYLTLEPRSPQRNSIEQLITLIRSEFAAEEMRKLIAEEEERRIAEERQRLLDAVSASLQSVAESSQGISFGAESVEQYNGEFELD
ncbi:MAG: tetratricopeptide repeat protein [Treponema sp.]|nr:tetratricopeptide repeat protein [Treponema sp.]